MSADSTKERSLAPYFVLWAGQAVSLFGSQLVQFALIWWLTRQTGSATVLATATLIAFLPQAFAGPLAGVLVDRWNRKRIMMAADGLTALATLVLAYLFWAGIATTWHVYLILFVRALSGSFHWPAMMSSTSLMVPDRHLARVNGLNQTLHGALNIVSAPTGAMLLAIMPMQGILAIDVGTAAVAMASLLFIFIPQPLSPQPLRPQPEKTREATPSEGQAMPRVSLASDLRDGLRYVQGWPGLMAVLAVFALINMVLTPAASLMPLLVTDHFNGDALQLGWIESAWGVGLVGGGLILGVWGGFRSRIVTALTGVVGLGFGILMIGLTPASAFMLALASMLFVGVTNPFINGPLLAIIQSSVAPNMQGRVLGLIASLSTLVTPLGLLMAGPLADALGVRIWYVAGGALSVILGLACFLVPAIMRIEEGSNGGPAPVSVPAAAGDLAEESPLTLSA